MNNIESVYGFLHHGRVKNNLPLSETSTSGNVVLSVCLIMLVFSVVFSAILLIPGLENSVEKMLRDSLGRTAGKSIGRVLGVLLFVIAFPIVKYTVGTNDKYQAAKSKFLALAQDEQARVAKKGARVFYLCIASLAVPVVLGLIG